MKPLYLKAANAAVVCCVHGIGKAKNCGELDGCFLLAGKQITQSFVPAGGKRSAMKASDDGGALQFYFFPTQRIAVFSDQRQRSFVMTFVPLGFTHVMKQGGG